MLDLKEAYKIVKKDDLSYKRKLVECVEMDDSFAFLFSSSEYCLEPYILVNKKDGKINYMSIPPLENLDKLNGGKNIKVEELINFEK